MSAPPAARLAQPEKIGVVQLRSSHIFSGPETVIVALSEGLKDTEFDSTILCVWGDARTPIPLADAARAKGLSVEVLRTSGKLNPWLVWKVLRFVKRRGVRIISSTGYKADLIGWVVARLLGIRFITTIQGFVEKYPLRKRFYDAMTRWIARRSDLVVTVAESLRRELLAQGMSAERIVTVHNFVDVGRFKAEDAEAAGRIRRELGVPAGAPVIEILGRLNIEKGHTFFLQAAARVKPEFPSARFVIVGDSYLSLRSDLEREAAALGLQAEVVFTGYRTDIPDLLAAATVVVSSSLREGLPLALVEAMAAARPIVATAIDGIPELVDDGRTGILVPARDVERLADGILQLLRNPARAAEMGAAGRRLVETRFSAGRMASKMIEVYRAALR
jgi:glycosyltransferase involved in cell wall biosynthesis